MAEISYKEIATALLADLASVICEKANLSSDKFQDLTPQLVQELVTFLRNRSSQDIGEQNLYDVIKTNTYLLNDISQILLVNIVKLQDESERTRREDNFYRQQQLANCFRELRLAMQTICKKDMAETEDINYWVNRICELTQERSTVSLYAQFCRAIIRRDLEAINALLLEIEVEDYKQVEEIVEYTLVNLAGHKTFAALFDFLRRMQNKNIISSDELNLYTKTIQNKLKFIKSGSPLGINAKSKQQPVVSAPVDLLSSQQLFEFGLNYFLGHDVEKSYEIAVKFWLDAANQGHANSQLRLGICFRDGIGVEQSKEKAVEWFIRSAKQDNAQACYELGLCYMDGVGVQRNEDIAKEWLTKSANLGHVNAQFTLGATYLRFKSWGLATLEDYKAAAFWFEKAARQGHVEAQYKMGLHYWDGLDKENPKVGSNGYYCDDERNKRIAVEWFRKAANQGHNASQHAIGVYYCQRKKYWRAKYWFSKAANNGYARSQAALGQCYENGQGGKSIKKSVFWYSQAAEQGLSVRLCVNLGVRYYRGNEVVQSYSLAFKWFKKAVQKETGHWTDYDWEDRRYAYLWLGVCYERGHGTSQSFTDAVKCYKKAIGRDKPEEYEYADNGTIESEAMYRLGICYEEGTGVEQSYKLAAEWYIASTREGFYGQEDALYRLGVCYEEGKGVPKSIEKAIKLYEEATHRSWYQDPSPNAKFRLGLCYEEGRGTTQSLELAAKYFKDAADGGVQAAVKKIKDVKFKPYLRIEETSKTKRKRKKGVSND